VTSMMAAARDEGADIVFLRGLIAGEAGVMVWLGSGDKVVGRTSPVLIAGPFSAKSLIRSSVYKSSLLTHWS
jgi:hypothetical protein